MQGTLNLSNNDCPQANSKDLESVSQHYSGELVGYVRKVWPLALIMSLSKNPCMISSFNFSGVANYP